MLNTRYALVLLALVPPMVVHAQDELTKYLVSQGFSNVPYTDQVRVAPGGYVAYDTRYKKSPPLWYGPVKGETVTLIQGAQDIPVPKETITKIQGLNIELSIFGIHPTANLKSSKKLTYSAMTLKPSALPDANTFYDLLKPGMPLDSEFMLYGDKGNPLLYSNQHLYVILSVYYSTGVTITSESDTAITLSTGDKIADCPKAPADGDQPNGGKPKPDGQAADSSTPVTGQSEAARKSADVATGKLKQASVTGTESVKATTDKAGDKGGQSPSGSLPGGAGQYCRVNQSTVEFHSDHPVPIAAQLLRVMPEDPRWNLRG